MALVLRTKARAKCGECIAESCFIGVDVGLNVIIGKTTRSRYRDIERSVDDRWFTLLASLKFSWRLEIEG